LCCIEKDKNLLVPELRYTRPLFVDLDGTLVSTDTLWESLLLFIKKYPLKTHKLIKWFFLGKAKFKTHLSEYVVPNSEVLPYNSLVLDYISREKKSGREIYLVTASSQKIADTIAKKCDVFEAAIGTDGRTNRKGTNKLSAVKQLIGKREFDYIGNSYSDLKIWKEAHTALICSKNERLNRRLYKENENVIKIKPNKNTTIKHWIKALRTYQWSKNILVFLALFMSHRIFEANLFIKSVIAFFSFSFTASAVYILNDLLDLETDRKHPLKKHRPFADGKISIMSGVIAVPVLIILSFLIAVPFSHYLFVLILFAYLITTTAYSIYLKEIFIVDVILLGALYTLRILAGGFATDIQVSSWLLGFSGFFFLSLAFMKRYTDLVLFKKNDQVELFGRGYQIEDMDIVQKFGIASGFISLLILAMYITSEQVLVLYTQPLLLWIAIPIILYWLMNMWIATNRGKMTEDPIIYAVKDRNSYIVFFLVLTIIILATII
jgi:4-hydroxybenzoate polyprenyltransferase